ncbi:MAG: helix-turn-helix domain-containing protein [Bryobacteraceae bacterium]|nr:helix-turn-helix domain-containing protein [Bryobacteraceae bacterium]
MTIEELLDALEKSIEALCRHNEYLTVSLAEAAANRNFSRTRGAQKGEADREVHWSFPVSEPGLGRPDVLRRHMERAGLTESELAGLLRVSAESLEGWLSGRHAVPSSVLSSLRVLELLTPAARRGRGLSKDAGKDPVAFRRNSRHPFSRIEEL